jgi:3-hydroxy-3-methylglutaryl CoA synthase
MRGIQSYGVHVPYRRLDRATIKEFLGTGGGSGQRAVASYDEDTTTMGVEAARLALRGGGGAPGPTALWFTSTTPAYVEKTNATTAHAALRLDRDVLAVDFGGAVRSGIGALRAALDSGGRPLLVASELRGGLPASADESGGGDAAAAFLIGDDEPLAIHLGGASATSEFLDRWRAPGEARTKQWEEKFGEVEYAPLAEQAWDAALKAAELSANQIDRVAVVGPHTRAVKSVARKLGVRDGVPADDLTATIGQAGAAHPGLALAAMLDEASPDEVLAVVSLADGADAVVFRATDAITTARPSRSVREQIACGAPITYAKFLSWRGALTMEPPRRPEPARVSASAAARSQEWKYAFVGSRDRTTGAVHLPPSRVSMTGGAVDDMDPIPMADAEGTIVTYTVDRLAYSPSPPVIFAVVDFDAPGGGEPGKGGRLPVELTDVDEADVQIGGRVEMTFRRLNSSDGIHNYFWKARPARG